MVVLNIEGQWSIPCLICGVSSKVNRKETFLISKFISNRFLKASSIHPLMDATIGLIVFQDIVNGPNYLDISGGS